MQTMTARNVEYLNAKEATAGDAFDFERPIRGFQRYIETSDWDARLSRCVARLDRVFLSVVILLTVVFFLSLARSF